MWQSFTTLNPIWGYWWAAVSLIFADIQANSKKLKEAGQEYIDQTQVNDLIPAARP